MRRGLALLVLIGVASAAAAQVRTIPKEAPRGEIRHLQGMYVEQVTHVEFLDQRRGQHQPVVGVADLGPGGELRRLAVQLDVHALEVADFAARRLLRDGAHLSRRCRRR